MSGPVSVIPPKGGDNGVASYAINCPGNSYVTGFTVTEDSSLPLDADGEQNDVLVPSLWPLTCSNGATVSGSASTRSMPKSTTYNAGRLGGFDSVTLNHGDLVDSVSFAPSSIKYGGSGGGTVSTVACPTGQVITGIYGKATATHMVTLGLRCRDKQE